MHHLQRVGAVEVDAPVLLLTRSPVRPTSFLRQRQPASSLSSDTVVMADAAGGISNTTSSDPAQPHKTVEEEKVQEEHPKPTDAVAAVVQPSPTASEHKEQDGSPQQSDAAETAALGGEGEDDDTVEPTRPSADVIYNDSSDSEDDDGHPAAPSTIPTTTSEPSTTHPHNPYLHLEEEIEAEEKRDREYAVPSLASISFDTPTSSSPATPFFAASALVAPPAAAAVPFRFDPTLVLIPDVDRFVRSSAPLLYPKLALTLSTPTTPLPTRLSALSTCVDLSRDPLHHPHLLEHGVLDELLLHSTASHPPIRLLSLTALLHLTPHLTPRLYLTSHGLLPRLCTLLIDQSPDVRTTASHVLLTTATPNAAVLYGDPVSPAAGDAASVLTFVVRRVGVEGCGGVVEGLLACVREGLRRKEGLIVGRYNGLVKVVRGLMGRVEEGEGEGVRVRVGWEGVVEGLGKVLAAAAGEEESRAEMVQEGVEGPLMRWMLHGRVGVRQSAVTALMHATVSVTMKHAVVRAGGVELVVGRVMEGEEDAAVLAALLQLLANLMETAKAKARVKEDEQIKDRVRQLADSGDKKTPSNLARSAQCVLHTYRTWQQ